MDQRIAGSGIGRRARAVIAPSVLVFAALGCTAEPPPLLPTPPCSVPEVDVTAEALNAGYDRDGEWLVSPVLDAPDGATRVGMLLGLVAGEAEVPAIEAQGIGRDGSKGPWVPVRRTWREAEQVVLMADLGMDAYGARIRVDAGGARMIRGMTWSAFVPEPPPVGPFLPIGVWRAALRPELAAIGVRSRSSWGARATTCTTRESSKYRMAIHHTVTPATGDIPSRLRGIQAYHMDTRGWCDTGYHFLLSLDGTLWEGRDVDLLGTHVGGHNSGNIGISFIGCFHSSGCDSWPPQVPPAEMIDSAGRLAGTLAGLYGITVGTSTVRGHRDYPDQTTSCPGDWLHARLGRIREVATAPTTPRFAAQFVAQSFPLARDPFPLAPGAEHAGYIDMRNTGSETWTPGVTKLGTTQPRDMTSPLAGPDWLAPNRAATVERSIPPGDVGRFAFTVRAPLSPGDYPQFFNLVHEGAAWFGDPDQGGPPDNQLQVRVTVTEPEPEPEPEPGPEPAPDAGDGWTLDVPDYDVPRPVDGGPGASTADDGSGCSCAIPGRSPRRGAAALALLFWVLTIVSAGLKRWERRLPAGPREEEPAGSRRSQPVNLPREYQQGLARPQPPP